MPVLARDRNARLYKNSVQKGQKKFLHFSPFFALIRNTGPTDTYVATGGNYLDIKIITQIILSKVGVVRIPLSFSSMHPGWKVQAHCTGFWGQLNNALFSAQQ